MVLGVAILGAVACGAGATDAADVAVVEIPAAAHAMPNAQSVAFSPDGTLVAAGVGGGLGGEAGRRLEGRVHVWEAASGRLVRTLDSLGDVVSLAFTHDGGGIARGTVYTPGDSVDADAVQGHSIATGEPLGRPFDGAVFALSPTRAAALVPFGPGICGIFERLARTDGKNADELRRHVSIPNHGAARLLAFSGDGGTFASVHVVETPLIARNGVERGRRLRLEGLAVGDTATFLPRRWIVSEKLHDCSALAVARDGRRLATGHRDGTVRVWSAEPLAELRSWRGGDGVAVRPVFSPADDALAVITQPTESLRWRRDRAAPGGFAFETVADGEECGIAIHDGAALDVTGRFRLPDGRFRIIHADRPAIAFNPQRLAFSPDGRQLLVGASGMTLVDRTTGRVIRRFDTDE